MKKAYVVLGIISVCLCACSIQKSNISEHSSNLENNQFPVPETEPQKDSVLVNSDDENVQLGVDNTSNDTSINVGVEYNSVKSNDERNLDDDEIDSIEERKLAEFEERRDKHIENLKIPFKEDQEVVLSNNEFKWSSFEAALSLPFLKIHSNEDAVKQLKKVKKLDCYERNKKTNDNISVQMIFCNPIDKNHTENEMKRSFWSSDYWEGELLDIYLGITDSKDNTTRIYPVFNHFKRMEGEVANVMFSQNASMIAVEQRPFGDTEAIYVRVLYETNIDAEHSGSSSGGPEDYYYTYLFAGPKHRFLKGWNDAYWYYVAMIAPCDNPESYEYIRTQMKFDGSQWTEQIVENDSERIDLRCNILDEEWMK